MMWNRKFVPAKVDMTLARRLIKRRLKPWFIIATTTLLVELIIISLLWGVGSVNLLRISTIALVALNALIALTYLIVFDNGAARLLLKNKKNNNQIETYCFVLKKSGYMRLSIHVLFTMMLIVVACCSFI